MVARLWLLLRGFISGWGQWGALKMTLYSVFKIYGKTHFRLTVWLGWGCRVPLTRPFLYARPLRRSTWGWSWERKAHSQATFSRLCVVQASVCCLVTEVALRVTVSAPLSTGYFLYLDSVLLDFIHNTSFREDVPNPPWGNNGQIFVLRFCDLVTLIFLFPKTVQGPCCLHHDSKCWARSLVGCLPSFYMCVLYVCNRISALVVAPFMPTV